MNNNNSDKFVGSSPTDYVPDIPTIHVETGIETFNNRIVTSKQALIDYILTMLGHPLVTVELTPSQFDVCISNAMHTYTKFATFADKYLCIEFSEYDEQAGLNVKSFNISQVKDINFVPPTHLGMTTSELTFGMSGAISQQATWRHFSFVSYQAFHEYKALAERMLFPKPDWTYNNITGKLLLYPSPYKLLHGNYRYSAGMNSRYKMPAVLTVECEPDLEELYSNECIRTLTFGYAKIILGTVRSKFTDVSLPGGGQISGDDMRREGQDMINAGIEMVRTNESFGNMFEIA